MVSPPSASIPLRAVRTRQTRELLVDLLYIMPQYALYLGLQILPFLIALPIIFTDQVDFLDVDVDYVGLANVTAPLSDRFFPALSRTVIFTITNYVMVFVYGFLLALAMFELISRFKRGFFTIIYMPWMVSGVGIGLHHGDAVFLRTPAASTCCWSIWESART